MSENKIIRNEILEDGNEPWGRRIFHAIVVGTKEDVLETILLNVVPNAVSGFISDCVSATFGVMLNGKEWYSRNRGFIGRNANTVSRYGTVFDKNNYHQANQNAISGGTRVTGPVKNSAGYIFSNIRFYEGEWPDDNTGKLIWMSAQAKANFVLNELQEHIDRYTEVSVKKFYAAAHAPERPADFMDDNWVWRNLNDCGYTIHEDGGVSINFPDPVFSRK